MDLTRKHRYIYIYYILYILHAWLWPLCFLHIVIYSTESHPVCLDGSIYIYTHFFIPRPLSDICRFHCRQADAAHVTHEIDAILAYVYYIDAQYIYIGQHKTFHVLVLRRRMEIGKNSWRLMSRQVLQKQWVVCAAAAVVVVVIINRVKAKIIVTIVRRMLRPCLTTIMKPPPRPSLAYHEGGWSCSTI